MISSGGARSTALGDRSKMAAVLNAAQSTSHVCREWAVIKNFGRNRYGRSCMKESLLAKLFAEYHEQRKRKLPCLRDAGPTPDFPLRETYVSVPARRPSLTAIQIISHDVRMSCVTCAPARSTLWTAWCVSSFPAMVSITSGLMSSSNQPGVPDK